MDKKPDFNENLWGLADLAPRLDMAAEANALLRGQANQEIEGVAEEVREENGVTVHIITVLNEKGAARLNRQPGRYITIDIPLEDEEDDIGEIAKVVAGQLKNLLRTAPSVAHPLLIVGLGNDNAIPDALGPRVVDMSYATRHLFHLHNLEGYSAVCAVAPGVLENSGIETAEIIDGICEHIHPSALIVVDSLAAASISRVGTTIQVCETGIRPGSGLGKRRSGIDSTMTGCPVIAIGVPTVVDTAAIIAETLTSLGQYWRGRAMIVPPQLDDAAYSYAEKQLLERFRGRLVVTPKDIDDLIARDAEIIAAAIAMMAHPAATKDNYHNFLR
ncbi:MAG: GPR endopeptidase [Clostridia bacterium]|nr:GPR endopeptidase [Clostridia bacterium]